MIEHLVSIFPELEFDEAYCHVFIASLILVGFTVIGSLVMKTPYGRFGKVNYGIKLNPRLGWFLMEVPAIISFTYFYFHGSYKFELIPLVFLTIWMIHYTYRALMFPYKIKVHKGAKKSFNVLVVGIGMIVTTIHGYLNAWWITELSLNYTNEYLSEPSFIIGSTIYYFGFFQIIRSDSILRDLRKEGLNNRDIRYKIPFGGLFKYVSSAQYLSELIAWLGFFIMTLSPGGLFILLISAANLIPRALSTHKWYRLNFQEYPENRKALVPWIL